MLIVRKCHYTYITKKKTSFEKIRKENTYMFRSSDLMVPTSPGVRSIPIISCPSQDLLWRSIDRVPKIYGIIIKIKKYLQDAPL